MRHGRPQLMVKVKRKVHTDGPRAAKSGHEYIYTKGPRCRGARTESWVIYMVHIKIRIHKRWRRHRLSQVEGEGRSNRRFERGSMNVVMMGGQTRVGMMKFMWWLNRNNWFGWSTPSLPLRLRHRPHLGQLCVPPRFCVFFRSHVLWNWPPTTRHVWLPNRIACHCRTCSPPGARAAIDSSREGTIPLTRIMWWWLN